jgi:hypothetical protein
MDNALWNPFVVEVRDLLSKDEILEQRRSAKARFERVLIVSDRHALVGRQHAVRGIDAHAIERTHCGVLTDVRPPAADLVGPVAFRDRAGPDNGSAGLTDAPSGGASAASGSYSAALFGLKGNADATSCVPAAFSARMSPGPDVSGSAGPLTVVRLFRTVLLSLAGFAGRDDLAMWVTAAGKPAILYETSSRRVS